MKQQTIRKSVTCSGIGLHSGEETSVTFLPAEADTGIQFVRIDLPGNPRIPALVENVMSVLRGTTIAVGEAKVLTVEHLLAAIAGLGIDNLLIEVKGVEVPAADGSSAYFVRALESAGLIEQDADKKIAVIVDGFNYEEDGVNFMVVPNDKFKVSFHIEYDNPLVGCQFESMEIDAEAFRNNIAEARTFALYEDIEQLKSCGLIKGGSLENAVVIGDGKILNKEPLRFEKELVRHKILDLIGDLYLLGMPVRGHIISSKSGHPSNVNLVRKLRKLIADGSNIVRVEPAGGSGPGALEKINLGITKIMERMPHRYPFLLVDRILEFEAEKHVVGIKNVTINEPFFQGHFPGHPIMPGVLIVEAMGQTGGMLMMNSVPEPEKKVVYFISLDKIKFRRPVFPGDQLRMELSMVKFRHRTCKMQGSAYVDGDLVAEAEMTAMIVDRGSLPDD